GIHHHRRFDAGVLLVDAGIGDVVEEEAKAGLVVKGIGELAAALEFDMAAEILAAAAVPIPYRELRRDDEVAADLGIEAEAAIAVGATLVGDQRAEDRTDNVEEAIAEAVFGAELGLFVLVQHVVGAAADGQQIRVRRLCRR